MSLNNLSQSDGYWVVDGERKSCWVGRDGFKLLMWVANGESSRAERWIERNQEILGENHIQRVLAETGGWGGHPMFGSYPKDPGIWNLENIRERIRRGDRPIKELTKLNEDTIRWMCNQSQTTGVAFEYVCIGTLKHAVGPGPPHGDWLTTGVGDHAIRQTAAFFRELISVPGAPFPDAKIVFHACNEWGAHNKWRMTVKKVNDWGTRFYRWAKEIEENGKKKTIHRVQFKSPGDEWVAEQWPEGYITVDGTTGHDIQIGVAPGEFKSALEHPERDRVRWWELPDTYEQLKADARGTPYGYNESKMICQKGEEQRLSDWYGPGGNSRGSWTTDLDHYLEWLENCKGAVRIMIIHDETGIQADGDAPQTDLEAALGGFEPPPPPPPKGVDYTRTVISPQYRDWLNRPRNPDGTYGDPDGLKDKNNRMNNPWTDREGIVHPPLTKAEMEEEILRSPEYRNKHSTG